MSVGAGVSSCEPRCAMHRSRSFVGFLQFVSLACAVAWVFLFLGTHGPRAHAQATYGEFLRRQRKHEENNNNTRRGGRGRGRGRGSSDVVLELLSDAPKAGAVCLDGSPPGYYYRQGWGSGENRFLIFIGKVTTSNTAPLPPLPSYLSSYSPFIKRICLLTFFHSFVSFPLYLLLFYFKTAAAGVMMSRIAILVRLPSLAAVAPGRRGSRPRDQFLAQIATSILTFTTGT